MIIFSGSAHPELAENIAAYLGKSLGKVDLQVFPDGERFVRIVENIRGQEVYIVQPIARLPNEYLMELLIMMDAARRASAARITAVIPYFGYARQDRKDQPRVPITAKLVANLLVAAGTDRLLALDLHAQQIQGFFDIPVDHLYAAPVIVNYLRKKMSKEVVVVAPDPGGLKMAYAYSHMLSGGLAIVAKQRRSATEVEAHDLVGDVKGMDCLLVDDMTTTAGTLCAAAEMLADRGARNVYAAVSHAILAEAALPRLKNSPIVELVTTDSVPQMDYNGFPVTVLTIAPLLGEALKRIHDNQSVTSLFRV